MRSPAVPPPTPELGALAESIVRKLMASHPLPRVPRVEWRRYRTTAGMAHYGTWVVTLGVGVLTDADRLERTLKHEYAHLLAFTRGGRRAAGHGAHWRAAMKDLGQDPDVRHSYSCDRNVARQSVELRCQKCGWEGSRRRRLVKGRRYFHRACGGQVHVVRILRDPGA